MAALIALGISCLVGFGSAGLGQGSVAVTCGAEHVCAEHGAGVAEGQGLDREDSLSLLARGVVSAPSGLSTLGTRATLASLSMEEAAAGLQRGSSGGGSTRFRRGTWRSLQPVPVNSSALGVEDVSAARVKTNIVLALGFEFQSAVATTRIYNVRTGTWRIGRDAPAPNYASAAVGLGSFYYAIGGFEVPTAFGLYSPRLDVWRELPDLPTGRSYSAAAVVGKFIYAIGGEIDFPNGEYNVSAVVERYDVKRKEWSEMAPLPQGLTGLRAESFGSKIFVFGGEILFLEPFGIVQVYDTEQNSWSTNAATMPTPRSYMFVGRAGRLIYIIGGWGVGEQFNASVSSKVEAYDPHTDEWETDLAAFKTPRAFGGAASYLDRIYTFGGAQVVDFSMPLDTSEVFKP
mmetsp:Transcript_110730/g.286187  ORF Transcript_110730/g.286187 Transcript_110730/m.286187 type:complete len:402 (-) Transcript_110730:101-1306(-)